jgi:predicted phage terminase large subunit-like protein
MATATLKVPSRSQLRRFAEEQARRSLMAFVLSGDITYKDDLCHHVIASYLEAFAARRIKRLIITIPPQHGKSRLCSVEFPAWVMARTPGHRFALGSYGADLSEKHTGSCLDRVRSFAFSRIFPDVGVRKSNGAKKSFTLTNGGSYLGVGVGGSLTGHSADTLIIDDPFKNFEEAHSRKRRDRVWDWYLSTALTRLQSNGGVLVITTRWHVDDLVGRLMDPKRQSEMRASGVPMEPWVYINLRGIAGEGDKIGRAPGEALAPSRYTADEVRARMIELGSYKSAALYDGEPRVAGGNHFSRKTATIIPAAVRSGLRWVRFWDLAAKEKQGSDSYASVRMAELPDGKVLVAAPERGVWNWPKAREVIRQTAITESKAGMVFQVGIESQGGFATATANIREVMPNTVSVREVTVHADKLVRALPWVAKGENGSLVFEAHPKLDELFTELEEFPDGEHDDLWDAMSGAHWMLGRQLAGGATLGRKDSSGFGDQGTGGRLEG